jgi:glycosyltransferase involved in cell wall biosynthesis
MTANAAIYYVSEAFDTSRDRLMGRHAAGESFLHAFARHGLVDSYYGYSATKPQFDEFKGRIQRLSGPETTVEWIPFARAGQLARPGCLFFGSPGIGELAWQRRHFRASAYSLCGLTHTTASHGVMDAIGSLHVAPVQSWDAVICTSDAVKDTFDYVLKTWADYLDDRLQAKAAAPVQLPVIPLGVDCDKFQPDERSAEARKRIREQQGIGEEDIAVLFVGRLAFHAKAHPLPMYQALEEAARVTGKRVHLIQAGWFANEAIGKVFKAGAARHCPSVNAIFLDGRKPEIRHEIWHAADIFTSLSDNIQETFGLTPIEAMAAGLPVVVTDWNGYRQTVRDGIDGIMVPTAMPPPGAGVELALRYAMGIDDYDAYVGHTGQFTAVDTAFCTQAYIKLMTDPELRKSMGEAGRKRVREDFDWPVIIAAYQALWAELQARREKDGETAPLRPGRPPHPLRADPFTVFSRYPSIRLDENAVLSLAPGADASLLAAMRKEPTVSVSNRLMASQEDCEKILSQLRANGPSRLPDLLSLVPKDGHRVVFLRSVGWMAKVGLISVSRGEGHGLDIT